MHGKGILTNLDTSKYEGFFVDNNKQGRGRSTSMNGTIYEGEYHLNQASGTGTQYTSFSTYTGTPHSIIVIIVYSSLFDNTHNMKDTSQKDLSMGRVQCCSPMDNDIKGHSKKVNSMAKEHSLGQIAACTKVHGKTTYNMA